MIVNRVEGVFGKKGLILALAAWSTALGAWGAEARVDGGGNGPAASAGSSSRSLSVSENGKSVSISESTDGGITVTTSYTVDGAPKTTVVRAANPAELARKSREAHELYRRYLGEGNGSGVSSGGATSARPGNGAAAFSSARSSSHGPSARADARASALVPGGAGHGSSPGTSMPDAREMLRQQIRQMMPQVGDHPQLLQLLDEPIESLDPKQQPADRATRKTNAGGRSAGNRR